MFQAGDTIGSYVLVKRIGDGAFGDVWLAEKMGLVKTKFALKLPKGSDIDVQIFGEEAEVWAQVSGHTNVVPIIEADTYSVRRNGTDISQEQIVIVSEYLPDGSLQALLKEKMAPEQAAEITLGILAGLNYLHTRKPAIIHRDLKPDNVLMQGETPRLTDFGISRALKTASYLQTERIAGTLPYMAPEEFDGHFSPRTDVWAAGIIFYQLLSGKLPFPQREMPSLIAAIVNDDPPPLPDAVPKQFQYIVQRALEKKRERRYGSANEMRKDLRDVMRGREIAAPTLPSPIAPERLIHESQSPSFVLLNPVKVPEPSRQPNFLKWVFAAVVALLIAGSALVCWIERRPAQANNIATNVAANSSPSAQTTDAATPTPSAPIADSRETANGPLVAEGTTKADIQTEPIRFGSNGNLSVWNRETQPQVDQFHHTSGGIISKWLIKPGQLEPCKSGRDVAKYIRYVPYITLDRGTTGGRVDGILSMSGPFVVDSIDVIEGIEVKNGERIGTLSYINNIIVTANVGPEDAAKIPVGVGAVFTEPRSRKSFNGIVIKTESGEVDIRLDYDKIFDAKRCLYVGPDVKGKVTFFSSIIPK